MNKDDLIRRWRIIEKHLKEMGVDAELDMLSRSNIVVMLKTNQNLSTLVEWGYQRWDDVTACWQSNDGGRSFGITFKKGKDWEVTQEDD